jgi:hypothetical protein
MNILGVRLNILIGPDPIAIPAPPSVLEALQEIEVTHSDRDRSGFRMTFAIGRSGPLDILGYDLVEAPLLQPNARVVLTVIFDVVPRVIMDGIVLTRDVVPGDRPGQGRLVLTGQDISVKLDIEEKNVEHPAQDETIIANKIALAYPQYLIVPKVVPPVVVDPPIPVDRTPQQHCTDWKYLGRMAKRFGHVTYIDAGPAPLTNTLYWGPPVVPAIQQPAINVNHGPLTNAYNLKFTDDALSTELISTSVLDRQTGVKIPVLTVMPTRTPLGLLPTAAKRVGSLRTVKMETSGLNAMQALARAQGKTDESSDDSIKVTGTLDSLKYNDILRARAPVDLRGAGFSFNGKYLVRSVTHHIARGQYTQDFMISRAEIGAATPGVRVG